MNLNKISQTKIFWLLAGTALRFECTELVAAPVDFAAETEFVRDKPGAGEELTRGNVARGESGTAMLWLAAATPPREGAPARSKAERTTFQIRVEVVDAGTGKPLPCRV